MITIIFILHMWTKLIIRYETRVEEKRESKVKGITCYKNNEICSCLSGCSGDDPPATETVSISVCTTVTLTSLCLYPSTHLDYACARARVFWWEDEERRLRNKACGNWVSGLFLREIERERDRDWEERSKK